MFERFLWNNDMHLKNFSMIESSSGWKLAPAYDLLNVSILLPQDKDELALTLVGKKKKIRRKHFVEFGKGLEMTEKQIDRVFNRALSNKDRAIELIDKSFLSEKMKIAYRGILESRYQQLNLQKT